MSNNPEAREIAKIIAEALASKSFSYPAGSPQSKRYVAAMWPAFYELAQDIMIFLLGDEFEVDEDPIYPIPYVIEEAP